MEELITGNDLMTSVEIAEISGKPHSDLMKAIREMEVAWVKIGQGNFSLTSYVDKSNRNQKCYLLTKNESLYIGTKFNDEARAKLILRWEKLEKTKQVEIIMPPTIPQTKKEWIKLAWEQEEVIEQQQLLISEQTPKVLAYDKVIDNKTTYTLASLADISGIGRTTVTKLLREFGWLKAISRSGTESTQYAKDMGYAKTIFETVPINGKEIKKKQFVLFRKGIDRFLIKI